ncbi:MAG TPA: hypothetical protein VKC53_02450, partial [Patescibacteria group bacterium]|nr:hypothetical protein [Patescibacteria group bacterium]
MPTLSSISPEIVKKYQDEIAKIGSDATAKRKSASLNKFFGWAEANGHIEASPMPAPIAIPQDNNAVITSKPKANISFRTWAILSTTLGIVIIIILLTLRLGYPIEFIKNFAAGLNNNPTAEVVINNQNALASPGPANPISANSAGNGPWNLYASLKLTDEGGQPQVGSQTITFKLYDSKSGGTSLYTSEPQTVTTDSNGSALISLDKVPTDLFFQNHQLFLEPEVGSVAVTERVPISTANVAANLGTYFSANPDTGATALTVPVIDSTGSLNLASESPAINAKAGNLLIQGQAVTIKAVDGGNGNIEINPDGSGIAHFLFEGNKGNFLNAQAPNLTNGSLYYGIVANNASGYNLIKLQNGSGTPITRFSVDALGNTYVGGDLNVKQDIATNGVDRLTSAGALKNITGYSQDSGNFTINQNPGDFASIVKTGEALNDVLNLTLDETGVATNSNYSTLVLNRINPGSAGMALLVNGNTTFNGQIKLGNFSSNPSDIGTGSLIYNTSDNQVYVWNGSAWTTMGGGGSFADLTSGTNTTAAMVVGSGASLDFTGTGTINASNVTCTGCVSNSELANSTITFAGNSGSSAISLGGTENIVGGSTITTTQSGSTLTADVTNDSLDFAQFKDAMTLDAATDIATAGFTLSTSGTGALNFASTGQVTFAGNVDATNGLDVTNDSTFTASGFFSLGDNGETGFINTSDWDISTSGDLSGIGTIAADGDITLTQATPSIFFVDSTAVSDAYSVNVDASNFTIVNTTDGRTDLSIDGTGNATFGANVT